MIVFPGGNGWITALRVSSQVKLRRECRKTLDESLQAAVLGVSSECVKSWVIRCMTNICLDLFLWGNSRDTELHNFMCNFLVQEEKKMQILQLFFQEMFHKSTYNLNTVATSCSFGFTGWWFFWNKRVFNLHAVLLSVWVLIQSGFNSFLQVRVASLGRALDHDRLSQEIFGERVCVLQSLCV